MSNFTRLDTTAFVKEVKTQNGLIGPMLPMMCTDSGSVSGNTVKFPVFKAAGGAQKPSGYGNDLTYDAGAATYATATVEKYYWAQLVDKAEAFLNDFNMMSAAARNGAVEIGEAIDGAIITALTAGATHKVAIEAGKKLTFAQMKAAIALMNKNKAFGERYCIMGPDNWSSFLENEQVTSRDFVGEQFPLMKRDNMVQWRGITWAMHPDLTTKVYMFEKSGVGFSTPNGLEVSVDPIPHKDADQILAKELGGATVIDADCLVEVTTA